MSSSDPAHRLPPTELDLVSARALSRQLTQEETPATGSPDGPAPETYVHLRPRPRAAASPAPRPVPAMPAPPPGLPPDELWGPLLDWCRAAARAESAFLVGPEGLLIECRGALSLDEAQRLGKELRGALEKARRLVPAEGASRVSLAVESAGTTLTGFSPALGNGQALTIGFLGREPVPAPLRDEVFRGFARI